MPYCVSCHLYFYTVPLNLWPPELQSPCVAILLLYFHFSWMTKPGRHFIKWIQTRVAFGVERFVVKVKVTSQNKALALWILYLEIFKGIFINLEQTFTWTKDDLVRFWWPDITGHGHCTVTLWIPNLNNVMFHLEDCLKRESAGFS